MNKIIKIIYCAILPFLLMGASFALEVVKATTTTAPVVEESGALKTFMITFFSIGAIILFIVFMVFIIALIIMKIQKKIQDFNRKRKDYLFFDYEQNAQFCHNNRDYEMKYKNWRRVWITWKRSPVFCNTKDGLRQIGEYNGEALKKEGFFMVAVYNKIGLFKTIETIVLIPNKVKHIIKTIIINKQKVLLLECEGIDEVGSTDYYFAPLIPDPKKEQSFIDFSDFVRINFTDKVVYRNILKEELQEHRQAVVHAVESNPYLHQGRRKE